MKEIEVLVRLHTPIDEALEIVKRIAQHSKTVETVDTYYFDPLRDVLAPDDNYRLTASFRVRERNNEYSIAYKIDHHDSEGKWTYSDEFETSVENADIAKKIIECLGLEVLVTVNTRKYIYFNNDYEIVIEDVNDLGKFLEVEAKAIPDTLSPIEAKSQIERFIRHLGLKISRNFDGGKPELMLQKSKGLLDDEF